jgi:hypothetical protein
LDPLFHRLFIRTVAALAVPWLFVAAVPLPGTFPAACVVRADPFAFDLVPTAAANGARGTVALRFDTSPFGVTVTGDGNHSYHAVIETTGLAAGRTLIVWAATPALDQVVKLGRLADDGSLSAPISLNKFLVFVTAEPSADSPRWSGPILLRGISPSGRMHTMAGHGPFQGEACGNFGFRPGIGSL